MLPGEEQVPNYGKMDPREDVTPENRESELPSDPASNSMKPSELDLSESALSMASTHHHHHHHHRSQAAMAAQVLLDEKPEVSELSLMQAKDFGQPIASVASGSTDGYPAAEAMTVGLTAPASMANLFDTTAARTAGPVDTDAVLAPSPDITVASPVSPDSATVPDRVARSTEPEVVEVVDQSDTVIVNSSTKNFASREPASIAAYENASRHEVSSKASPNVGLAKSAGDLLSSLVRSCDNHPCPEAGDEATCGLRCDCLWTGSLCATIAHSVTKVLEPMTTSDVKPLVPLTTAESQQMSSCKDHDSVEACLSDTESPCHWVEESGCITKMLTQFRPTANIQ